MKDRSVSAQGIERWMLDSKFKLFEKTINAIARANQANQKLDEIFGERASFKAAFLKSYVWGDPKTMTWERFVEKKIVTSRAFATAYPGFKKWYRSQSGMDYSSAFSKYNDIRTNMESWYKDVFGFDAKMPDDVFSRAMGSNIADAKQFSALLARVDPDYLTASTGAKTKADEFDTLWGGIYGDDSEPDPLLRSAYQRTSQDATIGDFFNNFIRTSAQFKEKNPDFEAWAQIQTGTEGGDEHVNPMEYIAKVRSLRQQYEMLSETPGAVNEDLIRKALINGWSDERMALEFRKVDPLYRGTAQYANKADAIAGYWQNIFGVDARPPTDITDKFVRGATDDPTSVFDDIKQTAEFQTQYGNWGEFQTAQDYAGNTSKILRNPELYKLYKSTFESAFARVGIEAPPEFEKQMFHSGVDPDTINQNLNDYVQSKTSYEKMTGQAADLATAAGIGDKAAGGALGIRMKQALEAHKVYTNSKFISNRQETQNASGLVTQSI
jgi:hypothetical protein